MTANRTSPPLGALLAALLLADVLSAKRVPPPAPGFASAAAGLSPAELAALFDKDFGQEHTPAGATAAAAQASSADLAQGSGEDTGPGHVRTVLIPPELAELVGITPAMDPNSLEGDTRLLAAALIANVRKLGAQAVDNFPAAGAKLSGIRFVENSILSALHTFSTLAKRSA